MDMSKNTQAKAKNMDLNRLLSDMMVDGYFKNTNLIIKFFLLRLKNLIAYL